MGNKAYNFNATQSWESERDHHPNLSVYQAPHATTSLPSQVKNKLLSSCVRCRAYIITWCVSDSWNNSTFVPGGGEDGWLLMYNKSYVQYVSLPYRCVRYDPYSVVAMPSFPFRTSLKSHDNIYLKISAGFIRSNFSMKLTLISNYYNKSRCGELLPSWV